MLRYLEAFFRHRWLVTLPALLLMLTGSAFVFISTPQYGATTAIWVDRTTYFDIPRSDNSWQTPAENESARINQLLRTRTFSQAVADQVLGSNATDIERAKLSAEVRGNVGASSAGSNIMRVNFYDANPSVAVAGAQAVIDQYSEVVGQSATLQASEAIRFYEDRIKDYESNILPEANRALTEYLDNHPELRLNLREGNATDPAYAIVQQQSDVARQQYQSYKDKLDQIKVQSQATTTSLEASFRVIDSPTLIAGTGRLGKKTLVMFAGGGVAVALGYVFLYLSLVAELDRTLRNPVDVRRRLHLPVLDVIPTYQPGSQTDRRIGVGKRQDNRVSVSQRAEA